MTAVMCVTEELQVTAQLVGVMPRGHPGVLPTTPLVWRGILLVQISIFFKYMHNINFATYDHQSDR
jgi:hypothetical protein